MVTVYHNLNFSAHQESDAPELKDLELAGLVPGTEDLDEAFDLTVHRDGENWTDSQPVQFFGDRRSRRSTQEGDVFVRGDGRVYLVLTHGFRHLPHLLLPFLSDTPDKIPVDP